MPTSRPAPGSEKEESLRPRRGHLIPEGVGGRAGEEEEAELEQSRRLLEEEVEEAEPVEQQRSAKRKEGDGEAGDDGGEGVGAGDPPLLEAVGELPACLVWWAEEEEELRKEL